MTVFPPWRCTKTYGPSLGLSACFRQWRADSHCSRLHGYALSFRLEFEARDLDERNWVLDFGGLKAVRDYLLNTFDHATLVAEDDPELPAFMLLAERGVISLQVVPSTGCEAFAALVFRFTSRWMDVAGHFPRVRLVSVECREHEGNSAIYFGGPFD